MDLLGGQVEARGRPQLAGVVLATAVEMHQPRPVVREGGGQRVLDEGGAEPREPAGDLRVEEGVQRGAPRRGGVRVERGRGRLGRQRTGRERRAQRRVEHLDLARDEVADRHDAGVGLGTQARAPALDEGRERAQLGVVAGAVIGGRQREPRQERQHRCHEPRRGIDRGQLRPDRPQDGHAPGAEGDRLDEVALRGAGRGCRLGAPRDVEQGRNVRGGIRRCVVGPALEPGDVAALQRGLLVVHQLVRAQLVRDRVRGRDHGSHARTLPRAQGGDGQAAGDGQTCGSSARRVNPGQGTEAVRGDVDHGIQGPVQLRVAVPRAARPPARAAAPRADGPQRTRSTGTRTAARRPR